MMGMLHNGCLSNGSVKGKGLLFFKAINTYHLYTANNKISYVSFEVCLLFRSKNRMQSEKKIKGCLFIFQIILMKENPCLRFEMDIVLLVEWGQKPFALVAFK